MSIKLKTPSNGSVTLAPQDTASDVTVSVPAATGEMSTTNATQTFTNKTLTNPTINGFTGNTAVINIGSGQLYKDASGNVGIGTSSPAGKFAVSTGDSNKQFVVDLSSDPVVKIGLPAWYNIGSLAFINGTAAGEVMRIASNGNVGIGTSSPGAKLQVSGSTIIGDGTDITPTSSWGGQLTISGSGYSGGLAMNASGIWIGTNSPNRGVIFATDETERARIDSSGNLLVGTTSPVNNGRVSSVIGSTGSNFSGIFSGGNGATIGLYLNYPLTSGTAYMGYFVYNNVAVGSILSSSGGTTYNTTSDYRLKTDVQPMTNAIERLMQLELVNYAWLADGSRADGVIAHKAQEVVPQAVTGKKDEVDKDGKPVYQGVDYSKLVPLLSAALQEAVKRIEQLESQLNSGA